MLGIRSELSAPSRTKMLATRAALRAPSTKDCWMTWPIAWPAAEFGPSSILFDAAYQGAVLRVLQLQDPTLRAVQRVTAGLRRWMRRAGVSSVDALRGVAHAQEQ